MTEELVVVKRNGKRELVMFDKITSRIEKLCYNLDMNFIRPNEITFKVINGIYPNVTTVELDNLAAEISASMTTKHPDYAVLAARIAVSNLHKETRANKSFSDTIEILYSYYNEKTKKLSPLISDEVYKIVMENREKIDSAIVYNRDYEYSYFGFKTLERSYLLQINGKIIERPQHLLMRVSIGIHMNDIESAIETYNLMSEKWFTHATPTLFNAGTPRPQMSSCFLIAMKDDSIEGIFDTLKICANISKYAGGIGLHIHNIRATGTYIAGTNGMSNGIIPLLRVYNNCSRYVDQGGNKRPGSFAIYLEPWHSDIVEFLDLRKNTGSEEVRARDLFYALWVPDIFMKRVEKNEMWSLMCPHECPGLSDSYGEEFEKLYKKYESEKKYKSQIEAQKLWFHILEAQVETGQPYMLFKDACNEKSNQKNLGTIKSSNLCCEIVEYSAPDEVAVCNLASISLSKFVQRTTDGLGKEFNFDMLHKISKVLVRNLNKIIDLNFYPVEEARRSNMRHRPIGIGVQGLADAFILMRYPYESPEAQELNKKIFETIYHGALESSCELAKEYGTYSTYKGSPVSQGILQYDMWGVEPTNLWDWASLKKKIISNGLRNSLLLAPMPTASTSQILGNNESIEPFTSNIYSRRVLSGDFQIVNKYLLHDLVRMNLWNPEVKNQIIGNNGSISEIKCIPDDLKEIYKTAWEISMKVQIDMAADRGAFIDQSQSFNVFMAEPNFSKLTSMHFYSWKKGLKTGMYYLRTKGGSSAIKFTVDASQLKLSNDSSVKELEEKIETCTLLDKNGCGSCGS